MYYNRNNSFLFANATKIYQSKPNDSKIKKYSLCLANISKDSIANDMKKTLGLNGYFYDFSVDYVIIDTSDIIDIH